MFDAQVQASLATICNGEVEEIFQAEVPALLTQLKHGQKAKLSIELEFSRVPNTDTMINTTAKVTPKYPARTKTAVGQITGDCKLKVDKPQTKVVQLSISEKAE